MSHIHTILLVGAVLFTVRTLFHGFRYFAKGKAAGNRPDRFDTLVVLTIINFMACWWVAVLAGGDALNGKIVGDEYFLGDHGRYTPVSFEFWLYSLIHTVVTIMSFLVMLVGQFVRILAGRGDIGADADKLHPRGRGTV